MNSNASLPTRMNDYETLTRVRASRLPASLRRTSPPATSSSDSSSDESVARTTSSASELSATESSSFSSPAGTGPGNERMRAVTPSATSGNCQYCARSRAGTRTRLKQRRGRAFRHLADGNDGSCSFEGGGRGRPRLLGGRSRGVDGFSRALAGASGGDWRSRTDNAAHQSVTTSSERTGRTQPGQK